MTDRTTRPSETISRRIFCRRAAWAAGAAVAITRPFGARADDAAADYIDVHVHLGQPWAAREPLTADILLRWMDEHRISHAVVLPLISPEAWYYPITTEWVLKEAKSHPDRLLPFCDVDPRTDYLRGQKGILDTLKRYVDAGAIGLGEHKCGTAIDDPLNLEVFRAASELKLPILFHMDNRRNTDRPRPARPGKGPPGSPRIRLHRPRPRLVGVDLRRRRRRPDGQLSQDAGCPGRRHRPAHGQVSQPLWRLLGGQRRQLVEPRSGLRPRLPPPPRRSPPVRHRLPHSRSGHPAIQAFRTVRPARRRAAQDLPRKREATSGTCLDSPPIRRQCSCSRIRVPASIPLASRRADVGE